MRVSELIDLDCSDVVLGTCAHVRCEVKGRKQRTARRDAARTLEIWLKERSGNADEPVFATIRGDRLNRDAVEHIVRKYTLAASKRARPRRKARQSRHGDGPASEWCRSRGHFVVARPPVRRNKPNLHAFRYASQRDAGLVAACARIRIGAAQHLDRHYVPAREG